MHQSVTVESAAIVTGCRNCINKLQLGVLKKQQKFGDRNERQKDTEKMKFKKDEDEEEE